MNFKLDKPTVNYTFDYNDIVGRFEPGTFVESECGDVCLVIRDGRHEDLLLHLNTHRPIIISNNSEIKFRVLEGYNTITIGKTPGC